MIGLQRRNPPLEFDVLPQSARAVEDPLGGPQPHARTLLIQQGDQGIDGASRGLSQSAKGRIEHPASQFRDEGLESAVGEPGERGPLADLAEGCRILDGLALGQQEGETLLFG